LKLGDRKVIYLRLPILWEPFFCGILIIKVQREKYAITKIQL
jgi:hypothetical protein